MNQEREYSFFTIVKVYFFSETVINSILMPKGEWVTCILQDNTYYRIDLARILTSNPINVEWDPSPCYYEKEIFYI